ncbi:hypothetical protein Q8F55_002997 [Vanrija albida]|uniref:F-box domain-containing protein n=1 Tax=Vanrija albida TaxID=181172 RepID=A0ABR3QBG6_9TREE
MYDPQAGDFVVARLPASQPSTTTQQHLVASRVARTRATGKPDESAIWLDYTAFPSLVDTIVSSCADVKTLLSIRACSRRMRTVADRALPNHVCIDHTWVVGEHVVTYKAATYKAYDILGRRVESIPQYFGGYKAEVDKLRINTCPLLMMTPAELEQNSGPLKAVRILDHTPAADFVWGDKGAYVFAPDVRSGKVVLHYLGYALEYSDCLQDCKYCWATDTILVVVLSDLTSDKEKYRHWYEEDLQEVILMLHRLFKAAQSAEYPPSSIICVDLEAGLRKKCKQLLSAEIPSLIDLLSPRAWDLIDQEEYLDEYSVTFALNSLRNLVESNAIACPSLQEYKATLTDEEIRVELQPSRMMLEQLEDD